MTKTQAASITSALILAGYIPSITVLSDDSYSIEVVTLDGSKADASTLATFANNKGVSAKVSSATMS